MRRFEGGSARPVLVLRVFSQQTFAKNLSRFMPPGIFLARLLYGSLVNRVAHAWVLGAALSASRYVVAAYATASAIDCASVYRGAHPNSSRRRSLEPVTFCASTGR